MTKCEKILLLMTALFLLALGLGLGREREEPLRPAAAAPAGEAEAAVCLWIDLNTAGARELELLPGIGPALAERIIAWREAHGPLRSPEDLRQVEGIGDSVMEQIYSKMEEP